MALPSSLSSLIDEIELGRVTEDLLNEATPDRTGALEAVADDDVAVLGLEVVEDERPDREVVEGFLATASDIEARGFAVAEPPADLREETEPEGETTEARLGAVPGSAAGLPLAGEAREVRDVDDGTALVPPATEVRRVGVAEPPVPEAGVRVVVGVAFDIAEEVVVFFKGEDVVGAVLVPVEAVLVIVVVGFVEDELIEHQGSVTSRKPNKHTLATHLLHRGSASWLCTSCSRHASFRLTPGTCCGCRWFLRGCLSGRTYCHFHGRNLGFLRLR